MSLVFITGGIRSGKSAFAERLAAERGISILYAATGSGCDQEMEQRIKRHRERRPKCWGLLECPYDLSAISSAGTVYDLVLVDCLSSWVSNWLLLADEAQEGDKQAPLDIREQLKNWIFRIRQDAATYIVVSSEAGLGGVAMSSLGRRFQDVLGEANQMVAENADEVYAVFSGIPWRIKG